MSSRLVRPEYALLLAALSACATASNDAQIGTELPEAGSAGIAGAGGHAQSGAGSSNAGAGGMNSAGANSGGGSGGTLGTSGNAGTAGKGGAVGGAGAPTAGAPGAGAGGGGNACATPTTVTLSSVYDAEINAATPTANAAYVAEANIVRGGSGGSHRAVFWFDFSSVPAGKMLKTAKLQLTIANNPGLSKTMAVHRVSQASNRKWDETQVTWQVFKTGSNWTAAGGDFVAQASDTQAVTDTAPAGTVLTFNVLADAQSFSGTPATNYGWLLKDPLDSTNNSGEHLFIATRENTTSTPPKLVLTYCP